MLKKLLFLLAKNKFYSSYTIAEELGVGEKMAKAMLHDLVRFGYVEKRVFSSCSGNCDTCHSSSGNRDLQTRQSAIWMLTSKGITAAQKKTD